MTQGFLVKLASEEWERMQAFEETGIVEVGGPVRREFDRLPGVSAYSARDLTESLARYWEVIAFGPSDVIRNEWRIDPSAAHPDFAQAWRDARHLFGPTEEGSNFYDVLTAMLMIGGEYSAPFLDACARFGPAAAFIFPWLAHLAMMTNRPADSYALLVDDCGDRLAAQASEILRGSKEPPVGRFEDAMIGLHAPAYVEYSRVIPPDWRAGSGFHVYSQTELHANPVYSATFERMRGVAQSWAVTKVARDMADEDRSPEGVQSQALVLLNAVIAMPGLGPTRPLLQLTGLAPSILYRNGATLPLAEIGRRQSLSDAEKLTRAELDELDLVRTLLQPPEQPGPDVFDSLVTGRLANETNKRWMAFSSAETDRARTGGGMGFSV